MANLTVGDHGEITLPGEIRERYGLAPETSVRIVETRAGVLIIPLLDGPMSPELAKELADWQALAADSLAFPYETEAESVGRTRLPDDSRRSKMGRFEARPYHRSSVG
jgi:bifunctional DNA-binding transcriptional regulator/antitoxin component of YhaV-PrlF toxin-antitoxin module